MSRLFARGCFLMLASTTIFLTGCSSTGGYSSSSSTTSSSSEARGRGMELHDARAAAAFTDSGCSVVNGVTR